MTLPMQRTGFGSIQPQWSQAGCGGKAKGTQLEAPLGRRQGGATLPVESRASWPPAQALPAGGRLLRWSSQDGWMNPKPQSKGGEGPQGLRWEEAEEKPEQL